MDPLTITSTVIAISARCVRTARALYDLRGKYRDASMTITAIYSESTVISTSLAHIQGLCTRNPDALRSTLLERPELEATFDQALTGCVLVYSVLDDEVQRLYVAIEKDGLAGSMGRIKLIWKEDAMRDVLVQIRGQQAALGLLIQALQMGSIHDIRILLENNTTVLQSVAHQTTRFRHANPRVKAPGSVFELEIDDVASLYSVDSVATSTNFAFDDLVVNSQAYRRALAQSRGSVNLAPVQEQSENGSDADTIVETPKPEHGMTHEEVQHLLNEHEVLKQKYQLVKRYFFEQQSEMHQLQATVANLQNKIETLENEKEKEKERSAVERDRLLAEKDEIEKSRDFLEEENRRHTDFFRQSEERRKVLFARYDQDNKHKAERLQQLEVQIAKEREKRMLLESANADLSTKFDKRCNDVAALEGKLGASTQQHVKSESKIEELTSNLATKEAELQRYKGFESIIEQLRLLSPGLPASSPAPNTRPSSASHNPSAPVSPAPKSTPKMPSLMD
ncbi:hypothetical protein BU26DRAFT_502909 [Trematosphaeria pertusa]|uniref:Uncharacterized protein n=1 Tax=Trematosphaeria pertusa TaxID=390896 RepID=A0A6A6IS54_9PLEO|nr:uncharacterized protein BU26DRAFT_502909 [Trematosphaeria pertusa]KAF2252440.1 hypothetical protein BU26DRAFT_502909 [Trematosphaeria pertusa]